MTKADFDGKEDAKNQVAEGSIGESCRAGCGLDEREDNAVDRKVDSDLRMTSFD